MTHPAAESFRGRDGLIRVVGHRGARGLLPENSMIGFEFALRTGVRLLEFDVVMTADAVPVITHNHRVHAPSFRGPDGAFLRDEPKVADLTWAQMQQFDIGRLDGTTDYGKRFPDQAQLDGIGVPRLTELLALVARPQYADAALMLEFKSDPDQFGDGTHRARFVEAVVAEVRAAGLSQRVLLHSFDWVLLEECHRQAPDMAISYLSQLPENRDEVGEDSAKTFTPDFREQADQIPLFVAKAGGALWCPYVNDVTAKAVRLAHDLGLVVVVWTVNDRSEIDRMIDLRVDAIVTDYPGRVQRRLADRGLRWLGP